MTITAAEFIKGAVAPNQFPRTQVPEFAFFGRSNAGKSSLINMVLNRKSLVKVGAKPGMTREINFFMIRASCLDGGTPQHGAESTRKAILINTHTKHSGGTYRSYQKNTVHTFSIADLPGYGFAQVSLAQRNAIDTMLYEYCTRRIELKTIFFLIDIRRDPGEAEKKTYTFFLEQGITPVLVLTKVDKISKNSRLQHTLSFSSFFNCEKEAIVLTSSAKKEGREKLLQHIAARLTCSTSFPLWERSRIL